MNQTTNERGYRLKMDNKAVGRNSLFTWPTEISWPCVCLIVHKSDCSTIYCSRAGCDSGTCRFCMQNGNVHYTFHYNSLTRRRLIYESLEISGSHMFRRGRLYIRFVVFRNGLLMTVISCKCEYLACFYGAFNDRWYPERDAGCLLPLPVLQLCKCGTENVGQNLVDIYFRSLFLWMRKGRDASIFCRAMLQWLRVMSTTGQPQTYLCHRTVCRELYSLYSIGH
jgi:hypothetical protein